MSAARLAREYGLSLNEFVEDVVNLLAQLDGANMSAGPAELSRECCAAVWSAMVAALDASTLSGPERGRLTPMLLDVLLPFWKKHCADDPDIPGMLTSRASHYLQFRDPESQIRTAAGLVNRFMQQLGIAPDEQVALGRSLTALFAHRMLADTHRINEVRARFGIDLPLVAALTAIVQVTMNYEPVLRILRLV